MKIDLKRSVKIVGELTMEKLDIFFEKATALTHQDSTAPITFFIASRGGSIDMGFTMYDALKSILRVPLYTVGIGNVHSMAILLLTMGEKRFLTPNTTLFFHEFLRTFDRDEHHACSSLLDIGKNLYARQKTYADIIAKATDGMSTSQVMRLMKKEYDMSAQEAVSLGFAEMIDEKFTFF